MAAGAAPRTLGTCLALCSAQRPAGTQLKGLLNGTGWGAAQPAHRPSLVHLQFTVNQQNGASFPLLPTLSGEDGKNSKSSRDRKRGGSKHSLETEKRRVFPQKSPDIQTCSEPSPQGLSSLGLSTKGAPDRELTHLLPGFLQL